MIRLNTLRRARPQRQELLTPAAAPTARPGGPRDNFNGLRLVAALLVVYGHVAPDATGTFGLRLVMFFAISGFLLAASWQRDPHAWRFLQRRFWRVWPAYAVTIVVCAAVSAVFPSPDMPDISRLASWFYLSNLWFSGFDWGFFPSRNPLMNQSLWMMRYEVDIYLAFAAAGLLCRRHLWVVAAVVLAASARGGTEPIAGSGLLTCWSLFFSGTFSAGVLLHRFAWLRQTRPVAACMAGGIALLLAGERAAGLLLIIPPAAVWVGQRAWPVLRSAARFGDLSFGIFLWASPVQQVTRLWLAPDLPLAWQWAVVAVQAAALAWLSWRYIESPALRQRPRLQRPSPPMPLPGQASDAAKTGCGPAGMAPKPMAVAG